MSAAVDHEMSFNEEQKFFLHLSVCKKCNEEFDDAKKTKMIIKERIIRFNAPQTLINSIMQLTDINNALETKENLLYESSS